MNTSKRILLAVDDSEASSRATQYVADIIGGKSGTTIRLLHVVEPIPPDLLEFGGSENPAVEEKMEEGLKNEQREWLTESTRRTHHLLQKNRSILLNSGISPDAVETKTWMSVHKQNLALEILEAARKNNFRTVVVGRGSFARIRELFKKHVSDELVEKGEGLSIWVVQ